MVGLWLDAAAEEVGLPPRALPRLTGGGQWPRDRVRRPPPRAPLRGRVACPCRGPRRTGRGLDRATARTGSTRREAPRRRLPLHLLPDARGAAAPVAPRLGVALLGAPSSRAMRRTDGRDSDGARRPPSTRGTSRAGATGSPGSRDWCGDRGAPAPPRLLRAARVGDGLRPRAGRGAARVVAAAARPGRGARRSSTSRACAARTSTPSASSPPTPSRSTSCSPRARRSPTSSSRAACTPTMDLYKWACEVRRARRQRPRRRLLRARARRARGSTCRPRRTTCARSGYEPVRVETPDGRAEYVRRQRELVDALGPAAPPAGRGARRRGLAAVDASASRAASGRMTACCTCA